MPPNAQNRLKPNVLTLLCVGLSRDAFPPFTATSADAYAPLETPKCFGLKALIAFLSHLKLPLIFMVYLGAIDL